MVFSSACLSSASGIGVVSQVKASESCFYWSFKNLSSEEICPVVFSFHFDVVLFWTFQLIDIFLVKSLRSKKSVTVVQRVS